MEKEAPAHTPFPKASGLLLLAAMAGIVYAFGSQQTSASRFIVAAIAVAVLIPAARPIGAWLDANTARRRRSRDERERQKNAKRELHEACRDYTRSVGPKQPREQSDARMNHAEFKRRFDRAMENGADVNQMAYGEETLLTHFCAYAPGTVITALLEAGADPNKEDQRFQLPLVVAARACRRVAVDLLLKHGADPNRLCLHEHWESDIDYEDPGKTNAVMEAIGCKEPEILQSLLLAGGPLDLGFKRGYRYDEVTPLTYAVMNCRSRAARVMIEFGANIEVVDKEGKTLLMLAAKAGCREIAEALIVHGVDMNAETPCGESALSIAVGCKSAEFTELLLERGAMIDCSSGLTKELMMLLVRRGSSKALKLLLEKCGNSVANGDVLLKGVDNPLALAAADGRKDIVQILLEAGCTVNGIDNSGATPFINAATNGHAEIVRLLADAGADLERKDRDGKTALMLVAEKGDTTTLGLLISVRCSVDATSDEGLSALSLASKNRNYQCAKALIEAGADVNAPSGDSSPVRLAVANGDGALAGMLVRNGASCPPSLLERIQSYYYGPVASRTGGPYGQGPDDLIGAARQGDVETVTNLLEDHAGPNMRDSTGTTPLMHACMQGHLEAAEALIRWGADVQATDFDGCSAILLASMLAERKRVVELLLSSGADPNQSEHRGGMTPLIWAARRGDEELLDQLLEGGAEIFKGDKHGHDAMWWARNRGHLKIEQRLIMAMTRASRTNH